MKKFIPYEKLSKKEKRNVDTAKRSTWGDLNPVTRKPQNSKAYSRNKARSWKREMHENNSGISFLKPLYMKNKWIFFGISVVLIAINLLNADFSAYQQLSPTNFLPVIVIALVSFIIKTGVLSALLIGIKKL